MCVACGAEMQLVRVAGDETMMLLGDEHHTFECSACREVERRLIFTRAIDFSAAVSFELATTPRKPHTLPNGLVVMRNQDRDRLWELCNWIGWRVVDNRA